MIFLCSGEGASDIGVMDFDTRNGEHVLKLGAMGALLKQIIRHCRKNKFDHDEMKIIHKKELLDKKLNGNKKVLLRGVKSPHGSVYFTTQAQIFGVMANKEKKASNDDVVAVLFRDSDVSNSSTKTLWADKVSSIEKGFDLSGFKHGVGMVPKPTSEAWVLALLEENSVKRKELENETDRDYLKDILKESLKDTYHMEDDDLPSKISSGEFCFHRLNDLKSFYRFFKILCDAIYRLDRSTCSECQNFGIKKL